MDILTQGALDISSASNGDSIFFAIANQYNSVLNSFACDSVVYQYVNQSVIIVLFMLM